MEDSSGMAWTICSWFWVWGRQCVQAFIGHAVQGRQMAAQIGLCAVSERSREMRHACLAVGSLVGFSVIAGSSTGKYQVV